MGLKRKPRVRSLVPKRTGKMLTKKGPARDEKHLAPVRENGCLVCLSVLTEAHHVRSIAPRSLGKRVSDYLAVPLCTTCHRNLHAMNEGDFWEIQRKTWDVDPRDFIRSTPEGRAALEAIERLETR